MSTQNNYSLLIGKLDEFIRKYYKNQLIRGSLYTFTGLLLAFLMVNVLEYFGQFNTGIRTTIFWSYIVFAFYVLIRYIFIPLAHLLRIGKVINYEQASSIIGQHFPEVKDKLLNILQLKQNGGNGGSLDLIEASINQKITEIKPVPFANAINLKQNFRYARYAIIPLLAFALIQVVSPAMISDSSKRLMNYNKNFPKQAPFSFVVLNKELKAAQQEDFELEIKTNGKVLPNEVFIEQNGNLFKMQKTDKTDFTYLFKNLQHDMPFRLFADEFYSEEYLLDVLAKPNILNFTVQLEYPAYLGKKNETLINSGDLTIPAGTKVNWLFKTKNVNTLQIGINGEALPAEAKDADHFTFSKRFLHSSNYAIKTGNNELSKGDSLNYAINIIPDAFPAIQVTPRNDSLSPKTVYFMGQVEDDHGFKKLSFTYSFIKKEGKAVDAPAKNQINLSIQPAQLKQNFYHVFDLGAIGLESADELEYYFEVWDNDAVTGSKVTRTQVQVYKAPTKEELKQQAENNSKQMKEEMVEAIKEAKSLQKEMKSLQQKMLEKKELSWEDKKKLEEMLKREKELEKKINNLKEQSKENTQQEQQFTQTDQNILQKQEELQKMWDEVLSPELKQLMQKMENMMKLNNKEEMQKDLEQIELNNKEVEKELDRMLQMYKKLEVEQKMKENADALQKLAEKQEKLSEQTKDKKADQTELKKDQEKIDKEFKDIKKDLQKTEEKNQQLEKPMELPDTKPEQQEVDEQMKNSEQQLEQKENKKASESQKKSAKKMSEMSEKMNQAMKKKEQEQKEEDYEAMRMLLENLIQLSKDQEDLMQQMGNIQGYNPQYVKLAQKQKELKDNARLVEDSLYALSKRVPQISSFINRELGEVNFNMDKALKNFGDRNVQEGRARQQYIMTSVNNIAVMLSDVLKQMQQDMNSQSNASGSGMCKKPGKKPGNKPALGELMKMQEQLNEMMKNGMKPGGKDGKGSGMGSKQFAEMAAKQASIRRQIQQLQQQMQKEGKNGIGNQLQQIQQLMEQTEKELVNKQFNRQLMERQEEIKTRMLESEKAEKEREQDNKRESKTANEKPRTLPPDIEQFLKQKNKEEELLLTIPPTLQPFYRDKSKAYFNRIGK